MTATLTTLQEKGSRAVSLVEELHATGEKAAAALRELAEEIDGAMNGGSYRVAIWLPVLEQAHDLANLIDSTGPSTLTLAEARDEAVDLKHLLASAAENTENRERLLVRS